VNLDAQAWQHRKELFILLVLTMPDRLPYYGQLPEWIGWPVFRLETRPLHSCPSCITLDVKPNHNSDTGVSL